jgi:ribosomal protein L11 methyltransferase
MFLWSKFAEQRWVDAHKQTLRNRTGNDLVLIERLNRKRLQLEVACDPEKGRKLLAEFGGRLEQLPHNWLKHFSRNRQSKPLKIGKRLVILNVGGTSVSRGSRHKGPSHILIPAGAAFGTGEHVTTALSLRLLEQVTRRWEAHAPSRAVLRASRNALARAEKFSARRQKRHARRVRSPDQEWSLVDLGTGSGILALAARCFGARQILAIDNDAHAIATAKENARINRIDNIDFRLADVRAWRPTFQIDVITANLFSELLIEILPKLRRCLKLDGRLVLSGVLRDQETELIHALGRNKIAIAQIRCRGKWVTVLARRLEGRALPATP